MGVNVRYESAYNSFLLQPFEIGYRHLQVAFCRGSQETLTEMARERIIYRCPEGQAEFKPLSLMQRSVHVIVGCLETIGYLTLLVPFIVAAVDKFFNKPCFPEIVSLHRIHLEEGGLRSTLGKDDISLIRRNPFDRIHGECDPFYLNASWTTLRTKLKKLKRITSLAI